EVSRTTDAKFGDFSTNIALRVSHASKQSPQETAKILTDSLKDLPYVEKLEVAGPGFINFFIKSEYWQDQVSDVLILGEGFGSNDIGKDKKARVEFVSANPTGPLHFGNARGGPIGDVLASVLEFSGYKVLREYYHNDVGEQVRKLGESIVNVAAGLKLEDQEYKGEYVKDLANVILGSEATPESKKADSGQARMTSDEVGKEAVDILLEEILKDCRDMGIEFDKIFPESEFVNTGGTKEVLDHLREKGVLKEKEGALWFAPSDKFLNDRETVVIKSDGTFTYFANDITYHNIKFQDGPNLVIDVFGANHHGHVPRLQAVVKALGYDVSRFHVILYQWVRFRKGKDILKMSKRSGTFVTAREVLDEVGRDALRFFILMHDPNSHIDFDMELAKKKSKENPVYYIQYAHARICSILAKTGPVSSFHPASARSSQIPKVGQKNSVELRAVGSPPTAATRFDLLTSEYEINLIKQLSRLPELVCDICESFAVHRLTTYATELADSFHKFYENCRVVDENEDLMQARIALIQATKITLVNTLKLLGISAPEKM
ncbi:MAG: arginine--tRNA ligase, partial [Candidatus Curtissbacteria bacterium]|nr:arginine--tRNA ligase [Candidatus Curtissbacteria bacterium]